MSDLFIAFSLGMCGSIATALLMSAQRSTQTHSQIQPLRIVSAGGPAHISARPVSVGAINDAFLFGNLGKILFAVVIQIIICR